MFFNVFNHCPCITTHHKTLYPFCSIAIWSYPLSSSTPLHTLFSFPTASFLPVLDSGHLLNISLSIVFHRVSSPGQFFLGNIDSDILQFCLHAKLSIDFFFSAIPILSIVFTITAACLWLACLKFTSVDQN